MSSVAFDIPIMRDHIHEGNESFNLTVVKNLLPSGVNCDNHCMADITIVDTSGECLIMWYMIMYASFCCLIFHYNDIFI